MALNDRDLKEATLVGLRQLRSDIEVKILELERELRGARRAGGPTRRSLSPEARERIAAGQRKRWAAAKKAKGAEGARKRTGAGRKQAAAADAK